MFGTGNCDMMFNGYSTLKFHNNNAKYGGSISSHAGCRISFGESTSVMFNENKAIASGGAIYNCRLTFCGNSVVTFSSNSAVNGGGALYNTAEAKCYTSLHGNTTVSFTNNIARNGGAVLSNPNSRMLFDESVTVTFSNNTAIQGGAVYADNCSVLFTGYSVVKI